MVKRGARKNFGGTWIMMDSDGTHVIYNEHGTARETRPPITPEERGQPSSSSSTPMGAERKTGQGEVETEKKTIPEEAVRH